MCDAACCASCHFVMFLDESTDAILFCQCYMSKYHEIFLSKPMSSQHLEIASHGMPEKIEAGEPRNM